MELHVYVHHSFDGGPGGVDRALTEILTHVHELLARTGRIMADVNSMKAKLDEIDTATNNIAADIRTLQGQIGTGMSQADVDAVQARLDSTATALEAIAAETPDAPPAGGTTQG